MRSRAWPRCFPLAALGLARRRAGRAAAAIGLSEPRRGYGRPLLLAAACCAFGLAAAQPTIRRDDGGEVRSDVQALFVLDVSRSMLAAAGPTAETRLERAREAALELRAAIPEVRAGLAGLTDRALPYLFPTLDRRAFASTLQEAVTIESPPPQQVARVATSFDALAGLGTRGFFAPNLGRRVCVVLTDGESAPFTGPAAGCRLVVVQFWDPAERVLSQRRTGAAVSAGRRGACLGGEARPRRGRGGPRPGASSCSRLLSAKGRSRAASASERTTVALAPYVAFVGLVLVLALVFGRPRLPGPRDARTMVEA